MQTEDMPQTLGRYQIVRELGRGNMGVVYEGRDPSIGRSVAIKTMRSDRWGRANLNQEMMERFMREARTAGVLNHPNIITIYDVGQEEDVVYIAMEYVEGSDLGRIIAGRGNIDADKIVRWGVHICDALACAHEQGIVHRDIKPANIMVTCDGIIKVADFGIAHVTDSTLTQDGALIGTPGYMSPEQFLGKQVDGRSDVFSLAVVLYQMLTGEKPFSGDALPTIMHNVLKTDPIPPYELNCLIPEALSVVVMKALEKKPQDRYADCRLMANALQESIKDVPDINIIRCTSTSLMDTVAATEPPPPVRAANDGDGKQKRAGTDHDTATKLSTVDTNTDTHAEAYPVLGADKTHNVFWRHFRLLMGIVTVLCFVVGGAYYYAASSPAPPEAYDSGGESGGAAELAAVAVNVYVTDDLEIAFEFNKRLQQQDPELDTWIVNHLAVQTLRQPDIRGLVVQTLAPNADAGAMVVCDTQEAENGSARVKAPRNAPRVRFEILRNSRSLDRYDVDAPYWLRAQHFVLLASVLDQ